MRHHAAALEFTERPRPVISNGLLGMMLLVGTETVLFTCFISAYMVLRMAASPWPPVGTPPLTLGLSSFNTAVLILSSLVAWLTPKRTSLARSGVAACAALGFLFLCLQGVEFHRLYARGLTLQTGPYGAVFFTLIGCHGLHVIGGLAYWVAVLWGKDASGQRLGYSKIYWHFVTAVWLVLFSILYIV